MSSSLGAWGAPDYGPVTRRFRLDALLAQQGTRPAVLFGPSGCGKSVAAAHYSESAGRSAIWVDAGGGFPSVEWVIRSITRALDDSPPEAYEPESEGSQLVDLLESTRVAIGVAVGTAGVCVVLDDVGMPDAGSDVRGLRRLARALRSSASQLLVTTRSIAQWPADVLCEWGLMGPTELALTCDEASQLLERAGLSRLVPESMELLEACSGHAAVFSVLASQAACYGVETTVARTTSLDAWLERLILVQMSPELRRTLGVVSLLKSGNEREVAELGIVAPSRAMSDLAAAIPLVSVSRAGSGLATFRIHDLVDGFLRDRGLNTGPEISESVDDAVRLLTQRGDVLRAAVILLREDSFERNAAWIELNGRDLLAGGMYSQLLGLIETTPVHDLMARPRVLMLWAELCCEVGRLEEALAKCQAVRSLAEHANDTETVCRAISLRMQCLCRLHRLAEAEQLSIETLENPAWVRNRTLRGEALMCLGRAKLTRGEDARESAGIVAEASKLTESLPDSSHTRHTLVFLCSLVPVLSEGDWMSGLRVLSPLSSTPRQLISTRIMVMGNTGVMLTEIGRLHRSESMLRAAVAEAERSGLDSYLGAYLPPLGYALVGLGAVEDGLRLAGEGIHRSEVTADGAEAATDRVYFATVLRASGRLDDSLAEAERAFEYLSVQDNLGFRRLAALEVAASLLSLGDVSAARAWTESIASEGAPPNSYCRLRADMVLAEADRREGELGRAIERIARHEEYILSENPNWQVAMYCRAFPELVGLFSAAIGAERLPSHMLRMILPEHAEIAMTRSRPFLEDSVWRALGFRLFGEEEFTRFMARDGLPLCHVRMFGGLEVTIGSRSVRERDWKKRKARMLFTMLTIRRGQDVPRDQIFEHLWPDMDEERAKSNLYVVWSAMKSVLMGDAAEKGAKCPYVESLGGVCRSVRDVVRTDVDAFEAACARAHEAESDQRPSDALLAYRQIAELYRGDLLPGDCYEDWFVNLREHYRAEFMDAMLRATELLLDAGDPHTALIFVRRAIQHDQFREDLYQAAVRCQIAAGQRSSAIDTYMQCRDKLCDELGLDPSAEMRTLYDQILAMEERPSPVAFDPLSD